jgi:zinc transport system substrate-binding protein
VISFGRPCTAGHEAASQGPGWAGAPKAAASVDADFLLVGGIERFVDRIKESAGGQATLVQVEPRNTGDGIRAEVKRLAQLFGTDAQAEEVLARFVTTYDRLGQDLRVVRLPTAAGP